jgi:tRNA pseudouridine32 synthase/23S rRNA pseudouridine746 synthase
MLDGKPRVSAPSGTISLPLRPDPLDRPRQVVDPVHGKQAITHYELLSERHGTTLIALTPLTGRTHQLRIHCAHAEGLGCPIVGDRLYGKPGPRLFLHAAELSFIHPVTGQRMDFTAAPNDEP